MPSPCNALQRDSMVLRGTLRRCCAEWRKCCVLQAALKVLHNCARKVPVFCRCRNPLTSLAHESRACCVAHTEPPRHQPNLCPSAGGRCWALLCFPSIAHTVSSSRPEGVTAPVLSCVFDVSTRRSPGFLIQVQPRDLRTERLLLFQPCQMGQRTPFRYRRHVSKKRTSRRGQVSACQTCFGSSSEDRSASGTQSSVRKARVAQWFCARRAHPRGVLYLGFRGQAHECTFSHRSSRDFPIRFE